MKLTLIRILISPVVFLWGLFLLAAGTLFPVTMIVLISFICLLSEPFIWLFRKTGSYLEAPFDAFFNITGNSALDHFLGATVHLWGAFYITYAYIKTGKIFTGD